MEVGPGNVHTADYFKGVGKHKMYQLFLSHPVVESFFNLYSLSYMQLFQHPSSLSVLGVLWLVSSLPYSGLSHSFYEESAHHRATVRLPVGLPGLPDGRTLLSVRHSIVSIATASILI